MHKLIKEDKPKLEEDVNDDQEIKEGDNYEILCPPLE